MLTDSTPLTISDAHVALSAGNAAIQPGADHAITFGGATSVNIPPGGELFSDPVTLAVQPLSDLAISFLSAVAGDARRDLPLLR
ncbi:MAG: hypothetical protein WDM87_18485 [Terracidiphilus sp.]